MSSVFGKLAPALLALVPALALTACTSGSSSASGTVTTSPVDVGTPGAEAAALLKRDAVADLLESGSGPLESAFSNSLTATPEQALAVAFRFVCTGGAVVSVKAMQENTELAEVDAKKVTCDGSVASVSVAIDTPDPVSFEAVVPDGSPAGGYAYGYYVEKPRS